MDDGNLGRADVNSLAVSNLAQIFGAFWATDTPPGGFDY